MFFLSVFLNDLINNISHTLELALQLLEIYKNQLYIIILYILSAEELVEVNLVNPDKFNLNHTNIQMKKSLKRNE